MFSVTDLKSESSTFRVYRTGLFVVMSDFVRNILSAVLIRLLKVGSCLFNLKYMGRRRVSENDRVACRRLRSRQVDNFAVT